MKIQYHIHILMNIYSAELAVELILQMLTEINLFLNQSLY